MMDPSTRYYENSSVRSRIVEFLGGGAARSGTCRYLVQGDRAKLHSGRHPVRDLPAFLAGGAEIARSLWDRCSLVADLDIEYVNFDTPGEVYLHPERAFALQEPVRETVAELLGACGIVPLHLLSGRGHHFVWSIDRDSRAFLRLVQLGRVASQPARRHARAHPELESASPTFAAAFAGLGLVMEFLAGRVKQRAAPRSQIPVELTAVEVGASAAGREMISLDVSEYGDPLAARVLRVPFSVYLKPWQQHGAFDEAVLTQLRPFFTIPMQDLTLDDALEMMRDPQRTAQLAARSSAAIPDASAAMEKLIADYERSELRQFHRSYYAEEPNAPDDWPRTYDRTPLELWPACARLIVEQPNDLLLRPACIRRVVHVLLALGWHPRHIAGFIRSKYERDFGWTQFDQTDPATRADFYVRIFAGLFITGRDDLVDFNCTSAREAGLCFRMNCDDNLLRFRDSALTRRTHDKLAHRPFNRLLS